jgi:hypothetical protein
MEKVKGRETAEGYEAADFILSLGGKSERTDLHTYGKEWKEGLEGWGKQAQIYGCMLLYINYPFLCVGAGNPRRCTRRM